MARSEDAVAETSHKWQTTVGIAAPMQQTCSHVLFPETNTEMPPRHVSGCDFRSLAVFGEHVTMDDVSGPPIQPWRRAATVDIVLGRRYWSHLHPVQIAKTILDDSVLQSSPHDEHHAARRLAIFQFFENDMANTVGAYPGTGNSLHTARGRQFSWSVLR